MLILAEFFSADCVMFLLSLVKIRHEDVGEERFNIFRRNFTYPSEDGFRKSKYRDGPC